MLFILISLFILFGLLEISYFHLFSQFLIQTGAFLQNQCSIILEPSKHLEFNQALLCGKNMSPSAWKTILIRSSLYHVIVVSGAHLVFLFQLLSFFSHHFLKLKDKEGKFFYLKGLFLWFGLLSYTFLSGLGAPLVRALISQALQSLSIKAKWNWTSPQIHLFSLTTSLLLFPIWWTSQSLLLSATASLSLSYSRFIKSKAPLKKNFYSALFTYLLMLPLLFSWSSVHPRGILINFIFGPVFSLIILPISLFSELLRRILPFFGHFYDSFLDFIFILLMNFSEGIELPGAGSNSGISSSLGLGSINSSSSSSSNSYLGWIYWATILLIYFVLFQTNRRKNWSF